MTPARLSRPHPKRDGEVALWGGSFGVVLGLHGAIAAGALAWAAAPPPPAPPPAALVLELAPLPAAPTVTPTEIPPGPKQVQAPPPPPPEPEPEPEKVEEPPPVEKAAAPLPPPKPKPKPKPRRKPTPRPVREMPPAPEPPPPRPSAPATTAPQAAPVRSEVAAAPVVGAPSPSTANAIQAWQSVLLGHLERHKRYPRAAQWRRQQGVAHVRFTMNRAGRVLGVRLERSSGFEALDQETLDLIRRAQPLPKPPPEVAGESLELVVPVQFFIR